MMSDYVKKRLGKAGLELIIYCANLGLTDQQIGEYLMGMAYARLATAKLSVEEMCDILRRNTTS